MSLKYKTKVGKYRVATAVIHQNKVFSERCVFDHRKRSCTGTEKFYIRVIGPRRLKDINLFLYTDIILYKMLLN